MQVKILDKIEKRKYESNRKMDFQFTPRLLKISCIFSDEKNAGNFGTLAFFYEKMQAKWRITQ